jgi:uncharacterized protein Yka (UPF0111/DUF47 family)
MATENSSNTTPTPQTKPVDLTALTERLDKHADGIENVAAKPMADDMRLAAMAINRLIIEIRKAAASTNDAIARLVDHVGGQ